MNQANQKAVIQEANMNLINIRSAELGYFSTFFSNFGTQAALMVGFIAGSLSQVPGKDNPTDCHYFWIVLYWVSSALTFATGIHCLTVTVFIGVFGQGMALRGPLGSMVKAIEGMVIEQQQVMIAFCLTVFFFGLQAIGMYWIMMDTISAIITSIITFIAMYVWYRYSLRLYNRFSWSNIKFDWDSSNDPENELNDLSPSLQTTRNKSGNYGKKPTKSSDSAHSVKSLQGIEAFVSEEAKNLGGYLTLRGRGILGSDPWERKYFVVRNHLIYYYKDKRTFQLDPAKPINTRPIDLEGYTLVAGAVEPPYAISLVPLDPDDIRKAWKFRCDTVSEFNQWIEVFSDALKACSTSKTQGGLINVTDGGSEIKSQRGAMMIADDEE